MKNNAKRKLIYSINIYLMIVLIFMSISTGQAAVSASRTIENNVLTAGNGTNVTVVIQNDNVQRSLALQESIPSGWTLTRISDDADQFKPSTNEWVWFTVESNAAKTVKYKITVPSGAAPGIYNVKGNTTTNGSTKSVTGDSTIEVTNGSKDTIAPTTSISGVTEGGNYSDNVTITLTATDNVGGSGVNKTTFSITSGPSTTYTTPFVVSSEGPNNVKYWSTDNAGNVENTKSVNFTINKTVVVPGTFVFTVDKSSTTVNVGENALYSLTISNTGGIADTYDLATDKPSNATVSLGKKNVSVGPGNSSTIGLTINSSIAGIYTVNVTATSRADTNNSAKVTTVTNVIVPALAIENFKSVPNTAISNTNPAKISADVKKGIYNILLVEFGLVDVNNLLGKGVDTIFAFDRNFSGVQGTYNIPQPWPGTYAKIYGTIGNVAVSDVVTVYTASDVPGYLLVRGTFKKDSASNNTTALLWFNQTTGKLSNATTLIGDGGTPLSIIEGNSTFRIDIFKFVNGSITTGSGTIFTLHNITGNSSINNPRVVSNTVPNGKYKVYAMANDTNSSIIKWIDIDTIPASSPPSSGGSSSGGSGDGTYPTITARVTPKENVTAEPTVTATVQQTVKIVVPTTVEPAGTVKGTPVDITKKGTPGFGIVVAIGMLGAIYIMRKMK